MQPLKEATAEKHRIAEQTPFNQRMFRGELSPEDYLRYLEQQHAIFVALESMPLPHPDLARTEPILKDMQEIYNQGIAPGPILEATARYVAHLQGLGEAERGAHVYLNYLALMFGGQIMKQRIPSSGHLYDFQSMREAMGAVRAIQQDEWADEVNAGFDHHIAIFHDLESFTQNPSA
jgi:heme oxygenase